MAKPSLKISDKWHKKKGMKFSLPIINLYFVLEAN